MQMSSARPAEQQLHLLQRQLRFWAVTPPKLSSSQPEVVRLTLRGRINTACERLRGLAGGRPDAERAEQEQQLLRGVDTEQRQVQVLCGQGRLQAPSICKSKLPRALGLAQLPAA